MDQFDYPWRLTKQIEISRERAKAMAGKHWVCDYFVQSILFYAKDQKLEYKDSALLEPVYRP